MRNTFLWTGILASFTCAAQVLTPEDSLHAGLVRSDHTTVISGYGEAKVSYDMQLKTGQANLTRNVLFIGHRFSPRIALFSEMEVENARVEGGSAGGELSMEQLFLKFNVTRDIYLTAGLFIPRMGIINENHLPTTFNGNDRPFTEQLVIPATWREMGLGIYGTLPRIPGLHWSAALLNGLNSANLRHGSGLMEARGEGSQASAANLAITGALRYYWKDFQFQASGYYGGSAGLTQREADSLHLDYGAFGTPMAVWAADAQYLSQGLRVKLLATAVSIPDAGRINRAYASNTPELMTGAYAEVGYNLVHAFAPESKRELEFYVRGEKMDLNAAIPGNGIDDPTLDRTYLVTGLTYTPVSGVCIKADYVLRHTGAPNPALLVSAYPRQLPYYPDNGFLNLGVAYSF
jgi:hypothetical protein